MAETSKSSTPPSTSAPASGAGSSGGPGTPGVDPAMPPDTESGAALVAGASGAANALTDDALGGEEDGDGGSTDRSKSTIGNIR